MKRLKLTTQHLFTDDEWKHYASKYIGDSERRELFMKGNYERTLNYGNGRISHTRAVLKDVAPLELDNV